MMRLSKFLLLQQILCLSLPWSGSNNNNSYWAVSGNSANKKKEDPPSLAPSTQTQQPDNDKKSQVKTSSSSSSSSSSSQQQQQQDNFDFTIDTFVDNAAATDTNGMSPPVKLSFWTTPHRDWDSDLLHRLKPLVVRFDARLVNFHPHQATVSGYDIQCRSEQDEDNNFDITQLPMDCVTNCVNAGRYCAVQYTDLVVDTEHAGLTGADLVMESMRRLCVWIVYGGNKHRDGTTSSSSNSNNHNGILTYWNYITQIRATRCDMSLGNSCIDRVYREVGIDDKDIADCFHNAGGADPQIDSRNAILEEEVHRSSELIFSAFSNANNTNPDGSSLLTESDVIPYLSINGNPIFHPNNASETSDWQILAMVCNDFGNSKPAVCDFCLLECPNGNADHDPTRRCLWDLTCGDDRNLDDWMNGQGVFAAAAASNNNTDTATTTSAPTQKEEESSPQEETSVAPSVAPSATVVEKEKEKNDDNDGLDNNDISSPPLDNSTNANLNVMTNETLLPQPEPTHHSSKQTSPPGITTAPMPTSAPAYAAGPGYTQPKPNAPSYNSGNGGDSPTHTSIHHTNSSGGTLAAPHKSSSSSKSPNTTNAKSAIGGVFIALLCMGFAVGGIVVFRKWQYGKEYATVIHSAERAEGGLATTASHATENDLQLHVETGSAKKGGYYAPPSAESSKGTWG